MFTIVNYSSEHKSKWDRFVHQSVNGTLFHTFEFLDYHGSRFNDEIHMVGWKKGEELYAVMPMIIVNSCDRKKVARSPFGASFGGPCIPAKFKLKHAIALIDELLSYLKALDVNELRITLPPSVYNKPGGQYLDFAIARRGNLLCREVFNIIDLREVTDAFSVYEGRARTTLRKCESQFDFKPDCSIDLFYPILLEDKIRHDNALPTHSYEELKWLKEKFPGKVRFDVAIHKETKSKAGICYFYLSDETIMTFYMAQETNALRLNGTNFLVNQGVHKAIEQGISYFDFGGSTLGYQIQNIGVAEFKESFGAKGFLRDSYSLKID